MLAEKEITSASLARGLNKTPVAISRWCSNESQPSLESLFAVAKFLGVSVKELLIDNLETS